MDWNQVHGRWKQIKGQLRTQWSKLTDDDLEFARGSEEQLIGKLQERYGRTKEEVKKEVEEWLKRL